MTITEVLAKLEAADKAATPGPWAVEGNAIPWQPGFGSFDDQGASIDQVIDEATAGASMVVNRTVVVGGAQDEQGGAVGVLLQADADFIALTRNALPGLLAWCREARTMLEMLGVNGILVGPTAANSVKTFLARDMPVLGDSEGGEDGIQGQH